MVQKFKLSTAVGVEGGLPQLNCLWDLSWKEPQLGLG